MAWRVAKSLDHLLGQWNAAHPGRSKASDGAKGDAAHASRESDHNPWVKDGAVGVVTARDFTHDPAHGADFGKLAEAIRVSQDPRVKYVIYNRRIFRSYDKRITNGIIRAWQWTNYTGPNAHTKHGHVSVVPDKRWYDDARNWTLKLTLPPPKDIDEMTPKEFLDTKIGYKLRDGSDATVGDALRFASMVGDRLTEGGAVNAQLDRIEQNTADR